MIIGYVVCWRWSVNERKCDIHEALGSHPEITEDVLMQTTHITLFENQDMALKAIQNSHQWIRKNANKELLLNYIIKPVFNNGYNSNTHESEAILIDYEDLLPQRLKSKKV